MKINTPTVIKSLVLFVFWLVFPPLFLLFSFIWKMPRLAFRIIFTLLAPVTLFFLVLGAVLVMNFYQVHFVRGARAEIEAKTGLDFPSYQTVEKRHFVYGPTFMGDFTLEYSVKMDTAEIGNFYRQVEKQMEKSKCNSTGSDCSWAVDENGNYRFNSPGIEPATQETLELVIDKRNAVVKITCGSW